MSDILRWVCNLVPPFVFLVETMGGGSIFANSHAKQAAPMHPSEGLYHGTVQLIV